MSAILKPTLPAELVPVVQFFRDAKLSKATQRAYLSALKAWWIWCGGFGLTAWPPAIEVVEGYLVDLARRGLSLAWIQLTIAAFNEATRLAHLNEWRRAFRDHLEDKGTLAGIRNTIGSAATRQARPLLARELAEGLRAIPRTTLEGIRERAILLLGWSCALRRSELARFELRDIKRTATGFMVRIRKSKTDQAGAGATLRVVCLPASELCAACALSAWLEIRGDRPGPLFGIGKGGRLVARAVQRAATRLGLDPLEFSAHSLRAGLITSAHLAGVSEAEISRTSRHASVAQLRRYIRGADVAAQQTPAELTLGKLAAEKKSESQ